MVGCIRDFPTSAVVLFPDQATSEHYGQIKAELARMGRPIPDNDLRIAAIARQQGLPPATRDAHFAHVPGLQTLAGWPPSTHQPAFRRWRCAQRAILLLGHPQLRARQHLSMLGMIAAMLIEVRRFRTHPAR